MKKIFIFLFVFVCIFLISCEKQENIVSVEGSFYGKIVCENEIYYQFRANDNSCWWLLKEAEIGFIPEKELYILTYNNNGTTECNCPEYEECECYLYDDIFINIKLKED